MHPYSHYRFAIRFFILVCPGLLIGCTGSPGGKNSNSPEGMRNNAMGIYSASVVSLKLPLSDTCDDTMAIQRLKLTDSLTKFNIYGQLVGKVNETEKYVAILYTIPSDVQLPVLHTFDKSGQEISSLKLFIGNCCGENEGCSGLSTVLITKDLHIILKDSMQIFVRNKKHADKKQNIQIVNKQEQFKIDSTGRILRIE